MRRTLSLLVLWTAMSMALILATPTQAAADLTIMHTPPTDAVPGRQIYLTATLGGASVAEVTWRNSTMTSDLIAPMTNLSRLESSGWVYAAFIPSQDGPTQIRYAINASNPDGSYSESFFLSVQEPTSGGGGLTPAQQDEWILTMAASISMAGSVVAAMYWYTGRRLRRGAS